MPKNRTDFSIDELTFCIRLRDIHNVCLFAWTLDQNANDLTAGHAADDATVAPSRRQGLAELSRSQVLNSKQLFLIMLLAKSESEVFALQLGLSLGL